MNAPEDAYALTQYSSAWDEFEGRLADFLGYLAIPTIHETVRLHAPAGGGDERHIDIEGRFQNIAERSTEAIDVRIAGQRSLLFPVGPDVKGVPDAARAICSQLRHEWDVAHPSLLVAEGENASPLTMTRLALPAPEKVPDENVEHQRLAARRTVRRGVGGEELSIKMIRERVELVLNEHCGQVAADLDGDYPVEVDGVRFR